MGKVDPEVMKELKTEKERDDFKACLEAAKGLSASQMAAVFGSHSYGVSWSGCTKGSLAQAYALRDGRSYLGTKVFDTVLAALRAAKRTDHKAVKERREALKKANAAYAAYLRRLADRFEGIGLDCGAHAGGIWLHPDTAERALTALEAYAKEHGRFEDDESER